MSNTQKETPQSSFPYHLKLAREQCGWTQEFVASQIGTTVISISRWETGRMAPRGYFRARLCELFDKTEEQLGLTPSSTTVEQQTGIYDSATPLPPTTPLIGRDDQLSSLRQCLCNGENIALSGLPGAGKTALAVALANDSEVQAHFRDGILWAGLGPRPNILGHALRWGTLLDIPSGEIGEGKEAWVALRNAISQRRLLIILDDVWHSEDALLCQIGGPNCAHIITTRFSSIATQIVADDAAVIEELTDEEGITLLRTLAPQAVEQEPQKTQELVRTVGGLPLALILIGNYLRVQSYRSQPRRVSQTIQLLCDDARTRLDLQEPRSPAERHASQPGAKLISLGSIIAVTDQQLNEETRHALSALSVFPPKPNSFSEEAALAVTDCNIEILDTLTDTGLLQLNSTNRYMLHPTIADYANVQLLEQNGDFDRVHQCLVTYMTTLVAQHQKDHELLEKEYINILTALEAAFTQDGITELPRLVVAFTPFLLSHRLFDCAAYHLRRGYLTAALLEDNSGQAATLAALKQVFQCQGKSDGILKETLLTDF